ncbi:hypothetical protein [Sphingomonas sp. AX6]|uniref:hypothetical protein n=1 Tax=Sphingomonas sp. AX6 TaxID=2653171 RepID=UPI0013567529|nr:hypothetical protein [Sphingomonas sp. AX6]
MSKARAYLRSALERVASGGDIAADQLDAAVADPRLLNRAEKDAWQELSHWADDKDIRKKDPKYTASRRERMMNHIAALDGYLPKEIERGKHIGSHISQWWIVVAVGLCAAVFLLLW